MSYFLENEEVNEAVEEVKAQDGIASIEPLLDNRIVRAIREMGFEKLSPIQEQAIPYLLQGEDIIGQAQTGTGKTAAFGIPAIQHINPDVKKLQTIILCPTRELAIQAAEELRKIAKYMHGIKVLPVYGGQDISRQIAGLRGVQIIVGTPGRVMDHMRRRTIKLDLVNMVVLDEADEMLNMGFREDMELILGQIPGEHQTALFSATMPKPILEITDRFQKDAKIVKVAAKELTIPLVSQKFYRVKNQDKDAACVRLLEYYQPKLTLIFCNTKKKVDELADLLKQQGFQAEGLHGDLSQAQRDVAMNRFRNGGASILIATDVAARGIDVDDVEAVINYDIPQDIEYYVHRIGRTGRAGRKGRSFTFANSREIGKIREIERVCHTTITEKKLPGAAKVLKAKADKYLNKAWELHEHEDIELMKSFLQRKMEEEGCDALELAAAMLKLQVGDKGEEIAADETAPAVAFVFKSQVEQHIGEITYFRVIRGRIAEGTELVNTRTGNKEKISQLFAVAGKNRIKVTELSAGDIGCTVKLKGTRTNDTLSAPSAPVSIEPIVFPEPRYRAAVKAKEQSDEEKLGKVLNDAKFEDPTILVEYSKELKQTIIQGQGEHHLNILRTRIEKENKLSYDYIAPKIPYRETITKVAQADYRHKKQSGGAGQFGEVHMIIEPYYDGMPEPKNYKVPGKGDMIVNPKTKEEYDLPWGGKLQFYSAIVGGAIDARFMPAILKGIMEKMDEGPLTGSYARDIRVVVYDGKMHPVDSNEISFKLAARNAFKEAFRNAGPKIMEPIYNVEILVPSDYMGAVMSDLQNRRAMIAGMESDKGFDRLNAMVPLAELYRYSTTLSSLTSGSATYTMKFSSYEQVPADVQDKLLKAYTDTDDE